MVFLPQIHFHLLFFYHFSRVSFLRFEENVFLFLVERSRQGESQRSVGEGAGHRGRRLRGDERDEGDPADQRARGGVGAEGVVAR
jgi:hypothetical protein